MSPVSLSVVVPAYNEEVTLADVVSRSVAALRRCAHDFEVIIVNDGSGDSTGRIADGLHSADPAHVRVIHNPKRLGMVQAFESGYAEAQKEYILLLHGDGQYPPEAILSCVPLLPKYEVVLLVRRNKGYGAYRGALSACYRLLPRIFFGVDLVDPGCSKCMHRRVIQEIPLVSRGIFREAERLVRFSREHRPMGIVEVEITPRRGGVAHGAHLGLAAGALLDLLRVWAHIHLRRGES